MTKYIAHASYGEDGIRNQEAGDQTLKEICIRTMYFKPWDQFFHIENEDVRKQFGNNMIDIANNNNVGYDQNGRNTLLTQAEKVDFDFAKIVVKCECDCSSMVTIALLGAIYTVLGKDAYLKAKAILVVSGNCATTSTFNGRVKKLTMISVKIYTSSEYVGSTTNAEFGDIYNRAGSHIVAYIDDGNKISNTTTTTEVYKLETLKKGSTGNDVTIFESIMKKMGYYTGTIDTKFGSKCVAACNAFQTKYPECGTDGKPDGKFGPKCWAKALSLLDA